MSEKPGNQTPDTPSVSETELRDMKVDELRKLASERGVERTSGMRKEELVREVAKASGQHGQGGGRGENADQDAGSDEDAGPDGGELRTGPDTSRSLQYSQQVTSTEDEPERAGRSLATTHHQVIKDWAEARHGVPATVSGTEHGDHLGVLRFDFGGDDENLRHVDWDEWFATFDQRRLNFIYQEERSDGRQSNFFRLESPDREDA
jgi:Rho termination factor, N-terminal domain